MEFIKRNSKNIAICVLAILFICACIIIFYLVSNKKESNVLEEIKGEVIISDSSYVIINFNNENYLISNIKGKYDVGDEVLFKYLKDDLDNNESPKKIKVCDEELISKKEIPSNKNDEETKNPSTDVTNPSEEVNNSSLNENNSNGEIKKPSSNSNLNTTSKDADAEVMSYMNSLNNEFNATSIKDSVKNGFITVVDFIFYGGKIKGHTFAELTTAVKLNVLKMALYFDSKIEKYFPGYKETISNGANKIYTNIKNEIIKSYLTLTTTICSSNNELCANAKNGFQELKTNFGLTFDLIKDIAGDGLSNLKNWYEIWSGK